MPTSPHFIAPELIKGLRKGERRCSNSVSGKIFERANIKAHDVKGASSSVLISSDSILVLRKCFTTKMQRLRSISMMILCVCLVNKKEERHIHFLLTLLL